MRSKLIICMVLGCLLVAGNASAQNASQTVEVFATVGPQIEMLAPATVPMPAPVDNTWTGLVTYEIHGNTQYVDMYVDATCLYKGSTSSSINIIPIAGTGATVKALYGQPINGDPELLNWAGTPITWSVDEDPVTHIGITKITGGAVTINGMKGNRSVVRRYESGQGGSFSQDVDVQCNWFNPNAELPIGQYGGFVRLTAMVVPNPDGSLGTYVN
jgi:hypothetical protein